MNKTFEIISKYTSGEKTLEETNAELKKMKAGFYADGTTNMYAVCIIKGKTYEVKGRKLVEC